ncbi:lantibiotic dehydratase [Paenibacillus tyrfis]|uniref:lantibiotic dehydratase n=1 Tax=Paenibacillus tyrfis TaxID=1501230 RepID=UPI00209F01E8|nr:lantibiotic dehydratase [Paenibacillus tyrfis]MCP1311556.1 lantibiotic dehydratase [Paenibacillus tyrfis]
MKKKQLFTYNPYPIFMLRASTLPYELYEEMFVKMKFNLSSVYNLNVLRELIAVSSSSLYKSILEIKEKAPSKQSDKTHMGVSHYLNRATTRPTPFGLCAGVAIGTYSSNTVFNICDPMFRKRSRPDMKWLLNLIKDLENNINVVTQLEVKFNSLAVVRGNRIILPYITRYGNTVVDFEHQNSEYNEYSIRANELVLFVMESAFEQILFSQLVIKIKNQYPNAAIEQIHDFLHSLLLSEYLISNLKPPITISSPFDYVIQRLEHITGLDELNKQLKYLNQLINTYDLKPIGSGEIILEELNKCMISIQNTTPNLQVDLKALISKAEINNSVAEEIGKAIEVLILLFKERLGDEYIDEYKFDFIEKYGLYREVSLIELLDEDIGIGIPATYNYPQGKRRRKEASINQKKFVFLQKCVLDALNNNSLEVDLSNEKLEDLFEINQTDVTKLPTSIEVFANIIAKSCEDIDKGNYNVVLGSIISQGVGKSFGRFLDILDYGFKDKLKLALDHEREQFSSDVIFAEINFLSDIGRNNNVMVKENLSDYELVIGTSSSKKLNSISANDIFVGYKPGEGFYFKLKQNGKRIKLVSGHLLNSKQMPNICRFLLEITDAENYLVKPLDWGILEKSPFLPRITFGRVVLSPATWTIDSNTFTLFSNEKEIEWHEKVHRWREKWKVPQFVYLCMFDNKIMLNLENTNHLNDLRLEYKKLNDGTILKLTEVYDSFQNTFFQQNNLHYASEFVFPFYLHTTDNMIISNVQNVGKSPQTSHRPAYFPLNEWIYLKIYCPKTREEELIGEYLQKFCFENQIKWDRCFYVRYSDPYHHIRLRIRPKSCITEQTLSKVNLWVKEIEKYGLVTRVTIDTYDPEIERYGGHSLIDLAEDVFTVDSEISSIWLQFWNSKKLTIEKRVLAAISVIGIIKHFIKYKDEQIQWLESRVNHKEYSNLFRLKKSSFLKFINYIRNNEIYIDDELECVVFKMLKKRNSILSLYCKNVFRALENNSLTVNPLEILGSLVHMHLNRLFGIDNESEKEVLALSRYVLEMVDKSR